MVVAVGTGLVVVVASALMVMAEMTGVVIEVVVCAFAQGHVRVHLQRVYFKRHICELRLRLPHKQARRLIGTKWVLHASTCADGWT
eukprot:363965-Chlamydomonas_euryale.AAC.22